MRTLVVLTGETFGSVYGENRLSASSDKSDVTSLIELSNKYFGSSVELLFTQPFYKLSENISPSDWSVLLNTLNENRTSYDNALVIHGTDTMAYSSSALSYLTYLYLNTTIVFTGSNSPLSMADSDASVNFIQSITALKHFHERGILGTFIVFNGVNDLTRHALIHPGNRVKKDKWDNYCYKSYYLNEPIGQVLSIDHVDFDLTQLKVLTSACSEFLSITPIFSSRDVAAFKIYPGLDPSTLPVPKNGGARFFVIELYNSGTAPADDSEYSLRPWVKQVIKEEGAVFAVSQHEGNRGVYMDVYETSVKLRKDGVIPLRDMIWEAAIQKLMLAAGNFRSAHEISAYMQENIAGEIAAE